MAHIVKSFDQELKELGLMVMEMATMAADHVAQSTEALKLRDVSLAERVRNSDKAIDALQARIEERVVTMIAKRQPLAVDLRETIATMKIATDLERIGDLAKSNAKRVMIIAELVQPAGVGGNIALLGHQVQRQLAAVIAAYGARDKDLAREVWERDGDIDSLHTALFRELLTYMMEDPRNITYCTHLLFCAKNLERIGDHATNIAENIHYVVTGSALPLDRPKGQGTVD